MNEQAQMMNQQHQQLVNMNQNLMTMNNQMNSHQQQPQPQMVPMNRSYGVWAPPPQFQNSNPNPNPNPNSGSMKPAPSAFNNSLGPRGNWKGKKVNKPNDKRRKDQYKPLMAGSSTGGTNTIGTGGVGVGHPNYVNYQPPNLNELQHQNRMKTRKFFPKKKFNKNNMNMYTNMGSKINFNYNSRSAPYAPRNTTSFLIRAKKSGGIASLVSPCPQTPAVLPTPIFSPSREVLVDMAKEEWGVDGYGSMKGLIRLRSPGHEMEPHEDEEEDEGGSSESDLEEHVEVERRLDHDLSRFEMICDPSSVNVGGMEHQNVLENRVDDQDTHIAHLEEENLILKERLFLMERELGDLRRRMQCLERRRNGREEANEDVVENESESDSGSRGEEAHWMEDNNEDLNEDNVQGYGYSKGKSDDDSHAENFEAATTRRKNPTVKVERTVENHDNLLMEADKNDKITNVEDQEIIKSDEFTKANRTNEKAVVVVDVGEMMDKEMKEKDNMDDFESSEP